MCSKSNMPRNHFVFTFAISFINFGHFRRCAVAWFTFDPALSHAPGSGLIFSEPDLSMVSVDGWDYRVALGSVGFSRGIHYWEFTINKYTADTDPAFGIARIDAARDQMLGMDLNKVTLILPISLVGRVSRETYQYLIQ